MGGRESENVDGETEIYPSRRLVGNLTLQSQYWTNARTTMKPRRDGD